MCTMKPLPGTSLTEHALSQGDALISHWRVKSDYAWDMGVAVSKFLAGMKEGVLLGVYCGRCDRTLLPPRAFCELCFVPLSRWVELKDTGTVNTFSVSYVNWDATRRQTPEVPAVIDLAPAPGLLRAMLRAVGSTAPVPEWASCTSWAKWARTWGRSARR